MEQTHNTLKYVCLSDFHSGALSSVFTALDKNCAFDPDTVSPTTETLGAALGATLKSLNGKDAPPDLIMMGDSFDMSFSPPDRASHVLGTVLKSLYATPGALSQKMLFLPGNHDHALWTAERYDGRAEDGVVPGFRHVTAAFQPTNECPASRILEHLASTLGLDLKVPTYYPNMGLTNAAGDRAIVLHHGHFTESTYRAMNLVASVMSGRTDIGEDVETLEALNGNWIDFGWSTIGSGGLLGKDVTEAYHSLLTGAETAKFQQRIADHLAHIVATKFDLPPTKMIEEGLAIAARGIVESLVGNFSQLERYAYTAPLSAGSVDTLKSYLSKAVLPQMHKELGATLPDRTTFIFGHTHKPFEDQIITDGFSGPVGLYNTGGWVLDTALLSTVEGGSAVFIDDDLNTAALRLYGMPVNGQPTSVRVTTADIDRDGNNPLVQRLQHAVDQNADLWTAFSNAVAGDLELRQTMILRMTEESDSRANKLGGLV
ncbi:hypothetical protein [Shimia abyssi]|uniref:Calcineurin-like phosphoesterase family protein n=1 Tax=Shimia abyssi TaxID=1662395 RepID=A0A2P8F9R7_9RHOB|nr:hypothetical protein [Shimia abyssi]PSL18471.1 hypothetical protein CLV88_11048 [Shimia abyssi]